MKVIIDIWKRLDKLAFIIAIAVASLLYLAVMAGLGSPPGTGGPTPSVSPSRTPSASPTASLGVGGVDDGATPDQTVTETVTATATQKVTVTATATETVKVTVTRTATPASRSYNRPAGYDKPGYGWNLGGIDQSFALCVAKHESWKWPSMQAVRGIHGETVWDAENPYSTASGAFQFVDGTWQNYARQLGITIKHASDASPAVQAKVMLYVLGKGDFGHWNGTSCDYGT